MTFQCRPQNWPETTDPHKFVYEDIAIATFLLVSGVALRARLRDCDYVHAVSVLCVCVCVCVCVCEAILRCQLLWQEERDTLRLLRKQSFVDLGCGNGLLVHLLSSEGVSTK